MKKEGIQTRNRKMNSKKKKRRDSFPGYHEGFLPSSLEPRPQEIINYNHAINSAVPTTIAHPVPHYMYTPSNGTGGTMSEPMQLSSSALPAHSVVANPTSIIPDLSLQAPSGSQMGELVLTEHQSVLRSHSVCIIKIKIHLIISLFDKFLKY